jgi:hypothetical protein
MQTVPRTLLADTTGDIAAAVTAAFRGHISGLTLSAAGGTNTWGIAAGAAVNSTATDALSLPSALSKNGGVAWGVGTANGSLDTGALAANTWYHAFVIKRLDTGVVDALISLSATAPTLPTGYTVFRRVGSMRTNGSAQWYKFVQIGDTFMLDSPVLDASAVNAGAGLTVTLTVPNGVPVEAVFHMALNSTVVGAFLTVHSPLVAAQTVGVPTTNYQIVNPLAGQTDPSSIMRLPTITGALRLVSGTPGGGTQQAYLVTHGWIDTRGKD